MKRNMLILVLLAVPGVYAAEHRAAFATGRTYYAEGEYKKAAAQFQLALRDDPTNAETFYWMGMSYQVMADIAAPFGGKYNSRARACLTRAVELAPDQPKYRRELFAFLLDTSGSSRAARREAAEILSATAETDPEYSDMRWRFEEQRKHDRTVEARLGRLILAPPVTAYRIAEAPVSAWSSLRGAALVPPPVR